MTTIAVADSRRLADERHMAKSHEHHPNCYGNVSNYEWADAFYNKDAERFFRMFHPSVTQSASTSPYTNFGREEVADTFKWASDFYQRCDFVYQASTDAIEFLEWELVTANNMLMTGMTVLTKDSDGKVIKVFNGHRNLMETVLFAEHFVRGPKRQGTVALFHQKALKKYGLQPKFPRNPVGVNAVSQISATDYVNAFRLASDTAFAELCATNVTLSSSYVTNNMNGRERVSKSLELMAGFYESCTFYAEATHEQRTYLLYSGRLRNGLVISDGFLILVRDDSGKITQILDNPIPMHGGTLISAYLHKHFPDQAVAQQYFYNDSLFETAVKKYSLDRVYGENTRDLSSYKGFLAKFFIQV